MGEPFKIRDFSGGWSPSSDPVGIRSNAFLQFDNLRLTKDGAISNVGGTSVKRSYGNSIHSLFNTDISDVDTLYACDTAGRVYRDNTVIGTSASSSRAAFSTAFDFTIISSGDKKLKDDGSVVRNLGVGIATTPVTLFKKFFQTDTFSTWNFAFSDATGFNVAGGSQGSGKIGWSNVQANALDGYLGTAVASGTPVIDFNTIKVAGTTLTLAGGLDDTISIKINASVFNAVPRLEGLTSVIFAIHWLDSDGGTHASNFTFANDGTWDSQFELDLSVTRNSLNSIALDTGIGVIDWANISSIGIFFQSGFVDLFVDIALDDHFTGGPWSNADNLSNIEYMQVNIGNTGSYVAKSEAGPSTGFQYTSGFAFSILPEAPADPQVTDIWVFRRGNTLADWRRVLTFTSSNWSIAQIDGMTDAIAAQQDGWDISLISTQSIGEILDIVGPFEGRWFYFTNHFCYPSDILNPDLVSGADKVVRTTAGTHEKFQWAKALNEEIILVGTDKNVYILTGTFTTLPDNTIDVFYKPLHVKYPPVNRFSSYFNGLIFYMATDGWRSVSSQGANPIYVIPSTQRLYNGESCSGYSAVDKTNTPVCLVQNSLFGGANDRVEVYDFTRNYWYPIKLSGTVSAAAESIHGLPLFAVGNSVLQLNDFGVSFSSSVNFLTGQLDFGAPRRRKDYYTLHIGMQGTGNVTVSVAYDRGALTPLGVFGLGDTTDFSVDLVGVVGRHIQIQVFGPSVSSFNLQYLEIEFDPRPEQQTYLRIPTNFGGYGKKRIADQPFCIDTLNNTITCTPILDGTPLAAQTVAIANRKLTSSYQFQLTSSDLPAAYDFEYIFQGGLFEFYEFIQPSNVEKFPEPSEKFRFPTWNGDNGNLKRIRVWPIEMDLRFATVVWTPIVDGVILSSNTQTFIGDGTGHRTYLMQFPFDAFGIDYSGTLTSEAPFEVWKLLNPEIVQVLPVGKRFDQIGPEELGRYSKFTTMEVRLLAFGTIVHFTIYYQDDTEHQGIINTTNGIENTYELSLPRGIGGRIVRITFGPTAFLFHRYYLRVLVTKTGDQTEKGWVTIPEKG